MTSGEEDIERVTMLKEDISSTACELTMQYQRQYAFIINLSSLRNQEGMGGGAGEHLEEAVPQLHPIP